MVDIKEIKTIELVPFTLMTSSIAAIIGLIYAIILLITFGALAAFIPGVALIFASLGISMIILYPIGAFLVYTTLSFITALIYNMLVPRLGGLKLELEGDQVTSLPVVSFALILAGVSAIWAFIIGLLLTAVILPLTTIISTIIPIASQLAVATINNVTSILSMSNATNLTVNATNLTAANLPNGSAVGTAGVVLALMLIIGLPIAVFVLGFIGSALAAIFYNFMIPRVGGVRLIFASAGTAHEITSIPVVAASLAIASVALIFGIIIGIIELISMAAAGNAVLGVETLIYEILRYFIGTFIMVAIVTIIYNFLATRIGGVQLGLE
ncbi:MAG TPA: hypothetical protein VF324_07940 [Methanobacterium sp.]